MTDPGLQAEIEIPAQLDLANTVRGAKNPVLIGPTESWWCTRTPEGSGSLLLERKRPELVLATSWGDGAEWMLRQAPKLMGLDDDVSGFQPTGKVGELWRRKPFTLARTDIVWDAVVGAIFGQKVQTFHAKKSRKALARKYGELAPGPRQAHILPTPERVAEMGYYDFHPLNVERKRAEILIRTAREMRRMGDLSQRTPAQVQARLQRIRGIGPWTAAMITASALGDPDAVPVGDIHIPNTVAYLLAGEARATDERMLELLEPYAGHRWRVIRIAKSSGSAPRYGPRLDLYGSGLEMGR